jgi:hypothetical protein
LRTKQIPTLSHQSQAQCTENRVDACSQSVATEEDWQAKRSTRHCDSRKQTLSSNVALSRQEAKEKQEQAKANAE